MVLWPKKEKIYSSMVLWFCGLIIQWISGLYSLVFLFIINMFFCLPNETIQIFF